MSQRVRMPTTWPVRYALGLAALLAFAVVGVASAESIDAPAAVAQPPGSAPLLQATATPTTMASTAAIPAAAATPAAAAMAATATPAATVTVRDFEFSPSRLQIQVGDTVIWANSGQESHTATSMSGVWDTGTLRPGESSYFTFSQPGNYAYYCTIHPRMRGTISVSPSGMGQASSSSMQGNYDNGWMMGYGYSGNPMSAYGQSSMGGFGQGSLNYYYNPVNGNYSASPYLGYPYNMGYGAWWGGQYGYGYPFSYMGGYGYPGYASSTYPYSSFGGYGGYSPYASYGSGYYPYSYYGSLYSPYSYLNSSYPYSYLSAYGSAGNGYYPYGYTSPYASLYYSYYRYPYASAYGYYPYGSYSSFLPYYAQSYSTLLQNSYIQAIYGLQTPYYGSNYALPYSLYGIYGLPYTTYPFSPYIY